MICNASPLIFLARINQLTLLQKLFTSVVIPGAVKEEVLIENKSGYHVIHTAIKTGWIKAANPKQHTDFGLGQGENAAIQLARETKDKLATDDALAIKVASIYEIDTLRTTTIILMALQKGIIHKKQAISLINDIMAEGYYISPMHYAQLFTKISSR